MFLAVASFCLHLHALHFSSLYSTDLPCDSVVAFFSQRFDGRNRWILERDSVNKIGSLRQIGTGTEGSVTSRLREKLDFPQRKAVGGMVHNIEVKELDSSSWLAESKKGTTTAGCIVSACYTMLHSFKTNQNSVTYSTRPHCSSQISRFGCALCG